MYEVLPDVFLFRNVISISDQIALFDFYNYHKDNFYIPKLRTGKQMSVMMNCFGRHWNAKTYRYSPSRDDVDGKPVSSYPEGFDHIFKPLSIAAFPKYDPSWDICICNHYTIGISKLGTHQDNSESSSTMTSGHPVVSLSIGASCVFTLGKTGQDKKILLNGGDVILFGGQNRMIYHGVAKVMDNDYPMREIFHNNIGRLNFTFRKM